MMFHAHFRVHDRNLRTVLNGCEIRKHFSLLDQVLAFSSDELCRENVSLQNLDLNLVIRKFRENRISIERLWTVAGSLKAGSFIEKVADLANRDKSYREEWFQILKHVSELFNQSNVEYVVIKFLRYPWALMDDIDFLIPDPMEELKALESLQKAGFKFFQFRLLAHPLKIMSLTAEDGKAKVAIDIYPEPLWIRKKVSEGSIIISRRHFSKENGVEAFFPSPEDDLYLVGTHAYNHLRFTLAEILHGLEITSLYADTFDWKYLFNLARSYGTLDAIYAYLRILNLYSEAFRGQRSIPNDVLNKYEAENICKRINYWLYKKRSLTLPIVVPGFVGCVYSSVYHCKTLSECNRLSDLFYDFLTHYLTLSSKAILGKT